MRSRRIAAYSNSRSFDASRICFSSSLIRFSRSLPVIFMLPASVPLPLPVDFEISIISRISLIIVFGTMPCSYYTLSGYCDAG